MLLLARDKAVIQATRTAARALRQAPPLIVGTVSEALARIAGPGPGPTQLVCEAEVVGGALDHLLAAVADPFASRPVIVVGGTMAMLPAHVAQSPPDSQRLIAAMTTCAIQESRAAVQDASALRRSLSRGEIAVRFQPVVRVSDRKPMLLEVLARWNAAGQPLGADALVPLAEGAGLARELTEAVTRRAAAEMTGLKLHLPLRLAINLPLTVLRQVDLVAWLGRALRGSSVPFTRVTLELTESEAVTDRQPVRRALLRARDVGLEMLLDDIGPRDGRLWLLDLPFSGVKLDRRLVEDLPVSAAARQWTRCVVHRAHARGLSVTAEGVTDRRIWQAVAALGVDRAQGWGVGRPLPSAALRAWMAAWRSGQPAQARR